MAIFFGVKSEKIQNWRSNLRAEIIINFFKCFLGWCCEASSSLGLNTACLRSRLKNLPYDYFLCTLHFLSSIWSTLYMNSLSFFGWNVHQFSPYDCRTLEAAQCSQFTDAGFQALCRVTISFLTFKVKLVKTVCSKCGVKMTCWENVSHTVCCMETLTWAQKKSKITYLAVASVSTCTCGTVLCITDQLGNQFV